MPPHFTIPPEGKYDVPLGGELNLTCVAAGHPMPRVYWLEDNVKEIGEPAGAPIGRNVLELKSMQKSRNYTCVAENMLGSTSAQTQVLVKGEKSFWEVLLLKH